METTLLTTCASSIQAHLIKSRLEAEGIPCFLINEHFSDLMPHLYQMLGSGVRVTVLKSDLERARTFLPPQAGALTCPECGSENVVLKIRKHKWGAILIFLAIAMPFGNLLNQYRCKECQTEFTHNS